MKFWPSAAYLRPTAVTSTTVSAMVTTTAASAWRAISPVSSVTVWAPYWNDFLMGVKFTFFAYCLPVPMTGLGMSSATQAETGNDFLVPPHVLPLQVIQKLATLVDQLEQTTPGMVVLLVGSEMLCEFADAGGQQGHLHFRRAGVRVAATVLRDDFFLLLYRQRHLISPENLLFRCPFDKPAILARRGTMEQARHH